MTYPAAPGKPHHIWREAVVAHLQKGQSAEMLNHWVKGCLNPCGSTSRRKLSSGSVQNAGSTGELSVRFLPGIISKGGGGVAIGV